MSYFGTIFNPSGDFIDAPLSFNESGLFQSDDIYDIDPSENCPRIFDVRNFLPYWIVQEHENNRTLLVKFLQYYYDWLYCSDLSGLYVDNITDIFDIENIKQETKTAFVKSFIPQLETEAQNLSLNEIQNFILNLKRDVLSRKGTNDGIALFFTKLFNEIQEVFVVPSTEDFTIEIRLVTSDTQNIDEYVNAYNKYMHIAGTTANIEISTPQGSAFTENQEDQDIEDFLRQTPLGLTNTAEYDSPRLGNYYVYNLGDTASIDPVSGCIGSIHPRSIISNTSDMPTYTHPEWYFSVGGETLDFNSINIYEFCFLPLEGNPNTDILSCDQL